MLTYYSVNLNTIIVQELQVSSCKSKPQNNLEYDTFLFIVFDVSSQELFDQKRSQPLLTTTLICLKVQPNDKLWFYGA